MTDEILQLMEKRRGGKDDTEKYILLSKEIKSKCNKAKEVWLKQRLKIEMNKNNARLMHKNINSIAVKKPNNKSGCLKSESGNILVEKTEIIKRWTEYIQDLYNDDRIDTGVLFNEEGPPILITEVEDAIKQTKVRKTPGPGNITVEEIQALGNFGSEVLTKLFNDIYDTRYLPQDLKKSIYIPLPKKDRAIDCEDF